MSRSLRAALLITGTLVGNGASAQEPACASDSDANVACEIRIRGTGEGASDLGVYNVNVVLQRLTADPEQSLAFSIVVNASECNQAPKRFITEPARFDGEERELMFNFPLFLHGSQGDGDYCIKVSATDCDGGCADQVGLQIGEGAIMRKIEDPRLR